MADGCEWLNVKQATLQVVFNAGLNIQMREVLMPDFTEQATRVLKPDREWK
jgi:hypothetical protein